MKIKELKKLLKSKPAKTLTSDDFVSTGSTLLNLACTGYPYRGLVKGHYYFFVGDSISGKTWIALTILAEACLNKNFDEYRLIYDGNEGGAMMNIEKFFGSKVASRIELPTSSTIEEFYYDMDDCIKTKTPFIYILDSMDSLSSKEEGEKFDEQKSASRRGRDAPGFYTDGKAKKNSANLRRVISAIHKTGSILIIINQTRDNIGFGFEKKTRSGGRALTFYACIEMWTSVKSKIYKMVGGKSRQVGVMCKIQIRKNRITGSEKTIHIPIYHSFGIDNVGSCIDYLVGENHWKLYHNKIKAVELTNEPLSREGLVKYIEKLGLEKDLYELVTDIWNEIEGKSAIHRKKRYE